MTTLEQTQPTNHTPNDDGGAPRRNRPSPLGLFIAAAVTCLAIGVVAGRNIGDGGSSSSGTGGPPKRDFMFQVVGYTTPNQGGQTMNMYFHYRYDDGIATKDIPNYVDLRTRAINYLDAVDSSANPYWETLDKELCTQLKDAYPIEAISCQLQVYPDDRPGLPYEPGYHGTTYTIGDIDPLAIPGLTTNP